MINRFKIKTMKAILFKREDRYDLYANTDHKLASTALNPFGKLSKENCDEIFGVVDVDKLAEEEYPTFNLELNLTTSFNTLAQVPFINGFNKAMELNKEKLFTEDDINLAFVLGKNNDESRINKLINSKIQPTEIEVEIEMECKIGCDNFIFNGDKSICCGNKIKKLDSNGNLILKKL
jgi:hypothetical protein